MNDFENEWFWSFFLILSLVFFGYGRSQSSLSLYERDCGFFNGELVMRCKIFIFVINIVIVLCEVEDLEFNVVLVLWFDWKKLVLSVENM